MNGMEALAKTHLENCDEIVLTLMDTRTNKTVERIIDVKWLQENDGEFSTEPVRQRELIEGWIESRGNHQHETELHLIQFITK